MADRTTFARSVTTFSIAGQLQLIWRGRWIVLFSMLVAVALAWTIMFYSPPQYTATTVLAPTDSSASLLAQNDVQRVASLVRPGMMMSQAVPPFVRFQTVLRTQAAASELIRQHPDILMRLFPTQWNQQRHDWTRPSGPVATVKQLLYTMIHRPGWRAPDADSLATYLQAEVTLDQDMATGMVTVSYKNQDREFAEQFLTLLIGAADEILRRSERTQVRNRIEYLEKLADTVDNADLKSATISILGDQEKRNMVLEADQYYSVAPIAPPTAPIKPTQPQPAVMTIAALVLGLAFGVGILNVPSDIWKGLVPSSLRDRTRRMLRLAARTG